MIELKNVHAGYGRPDAFIAAVDGIDLTIGENEILGIAGESGSGKSTLLRSIYGDFSGGLKLREGSITGHFRDPETGAPLIRESSTFQNLWWDVMSYVPQGSMSVLNPVMKIGKQIIDGLPARETRGSKQDLRRRLATFLAGFGLPETVLDSYPHQLSGGMRQRVLVANAAFVNPQLILADEPTTALDVVVQKRILLMLVEIQRRLRNTLIIVSHDLGVHYQITDRIAIAYRGKIVEVGPTDQVFANPQHDYTKALIASLPRIGAEAAPPRRVDVLATALPS